MILYNYINSPKSNDTLTFRSAGVQISIMARAKITAYSIGTIISDKDLRFAYTSISQVFSFQAVSFPLRKLRRL